MKPRFRIYIGSQDVFNRELKSSDVAYFCFATRKYVVLIDLNKQTV